MEEEQTLNRQITVTEATIKFTDGTLFHASSKLLKALNRRVRKENKLPLLILPVNGDIGLQWIED
jgi:hypothetical protein